MLRRPAGGAFLPGRQVASWNQGEQVEGLVAGIDAAGRATLAWARDITASHTVVETVSAPPGGAFGAVERIGTSVPIGGEPALAVAPDGRALLAYESVRTGVTVAEREPGAARFGAPHAVVATPEAGFFPLTAAIAEGGAAVVAWRPEELTAPPGVRVSTRAAAGPFGPARDAARGRPRRNSGGSFSLVGYGPGAPPVDVTDLRATIAADGFALTWADSLDDLGEGVPQAAAGALAGGPVTPAALAPAVRPAVSLAPLALADGRAGRRRHGRRPPPVRRRPAAPRARRRGARA